MSEMMDESFIDLLDQYLDTEEMEMKKRSDIMYGRTVNQRISSESSFTIEDTISIGKYVNDCLGIIGDCSTLYHSGLKELGSNFIMGVSNDFANKNPELVKEGYLLLVIDARGNRGTYINPLFLEKILKKEEAEKELKVLSRKRDIDLQTLDQFYSQYQEQKRIVEQNEVFYNVLKETHKVKQLRKIIESNERED